LHGYDRTGRFGIPAPAPFRRCRAFGGLSARTGQRPLRHGIAGREPRAEPNRRSAEARPVRRFRAGRRHADRCGDRARRRRDAAPQAARGDLSSGALPRGPRAHTGAAAGRSRNRDPRGAARAGVGLGRDRRGGAADPRRRAVRAHGTAGPGLVLGGGPDGAERRLQGLRGAGYPVDGRAPRRRRGRLLLPSLRDGRHHPQSGPSSRQRVGGVPARLTGCAATRKNNFPTHPEMAFILLDDARLASAARSPRARSACSGPHFAATMASANIRTIRAEPALSRARLAPRYCRLAAWPSGASLSWTWRLTSSRAPASNAPPGPVPTVLTPAPGRPICTLAP